MTMPSLAHRATILTISSVAVLAVAAACGGAGPRAEVVAVAQPTAPPPDTVSLSAEAVQLAGISLAIAESIPWREAWRAPARLVLDPAVTHTLGAVAEGRVSRVLVEVGDRVAAGQPLVAIHSHELTDVRSEVASAAATDAETETTLGVARSAAARAERLLAIRALSHAYA